MSPQSLKLHSFGLCLGRLVLSLALVGCAGTSTLPVSMAALRIVALPSGAEVPAADLEAAMLGARAIYVGERHDAAVDHRVQAWVAERLAARDPSFALGLEMIQRPYQDALDAWSRREIDDETLLLRTEWAERWRMDFAMYRPILAAARDAGASLLALNAPREWTRAISRGGLDSLAPEIRGALPELDLGNDDHRAMVLEALAGHGGHGGGEMDPAMLERFYVAQVVWDETMGEGVARALGAEGAPHRVITIAGRMHVQRGLGIPRCASRRVPGLESVVILPLTEEEARAEVGSATPLADYAIVVEE